MVFDSPGVPQGSLGATLDVSAKMAYKRRLIDLHTTLAEAQRCHDLARAAQVQADIDWLNSELAALGLGGRNRQVDADVERARSTVTKAIKATVYKESVHLKKDKNICRNQDRGRQHNMAERGLDKRLGMG